MKITVLGSSHGNPEIGRAQTAVLIETQGRYYLVDAGEPVNYSLVQRGLRAAQISAVFITHMHIDHTGGLPFLLEQAGKHRPIYPDIRLQFYLPDPAAKAALDMWSNVNGGCWGRGAEMHTLDAGTIFDDGILRASFVPTCHVAPAADGSARSYSVIIDTEGKKVMFSGDLSPEFTDFSVENARECDLVFCELTHFPLAKALPALQQLKPEKLIFYHLHTPHQLPEGKAKVLEQCAGLPYPVVLSDDGEVVML